MILQLEKEEHEFEVDELRAMLEDVNEELSLKESELEDKERKLRELENMVSTKKGYE